MDCDASLDLPDLLVLASPVVAGTADLVMGARRPEPRAWPLHARVANRWLARRVRTLNGAPLTDLGPMRVARRVTLTELDLVDRRSGWPLEMVLKAARAGWRIEERPMPYLRRAGTSKVTGTARGTLPAVADMRRELVAWERTPRRPAATAPTSEVPGSGR